jgi:hypothetical protein
MDVNELNCCGWFTSGRVVSIRVGFSWPSLVQVRASRFWMQLHFSQRRPDGSQRTQDVRVSWTHCRFGGYRPWLHCLCGRRVGRLYDSGICFGCRDCFDLIYESQRKSTKGRRHFQACKRRMLLGGEALLSAPFPPRPKGMRSKTYLGQRRRIEKLEVGLQEHRRFKFRKPNYAALAYYLPPDVYK